MSDFNSQSGSSHYIDKLVKYTIDDPVYSIHEHSIDLKANHIYLMGEESYIHPDTDGEEPGVEFAMANRFIKNLNIMMRKTNDPILIHMKTCGGDWAEGMAIYDAIKACPNPITILSYTHARSMSSIIFLAANKRVMMPHSTYMIHDGTMAQHGTVKQFYTEAEQLKKAGDQMMKIYIDNLKEHGKHSKWSRERIDKKLREMMDKKEEVYFDADETISFGFADEVFGSDGTYDWSTLLEYTEEQLKR